MNRRTQFKFQQLLVIVVAWLVVGFLIAVYDHQILYTKNSLGPAADYSFFLSVMLNMGSALFGALLGGSFLIFYINVKYRDKSYGYTVLAVTCSFILIVLFIHMVFMLLGLTDSHRLLKNGLVWAVVVAITQLLLQINSKFGQGIFWNIIRGKYNTPKEESKIFMFLDLNSSTAIAEELGDKKYHEFLKDIFTDVTNPILDNKGEIYQYVGDEVIIAWKYDDGIKENKCIQCFFDVKAQLGEKKEKYFTLYGLIPSFKAGIHCGRVVAGEIGIIKRDITYSGDVLNTASRIQELCREFHAEVIVSADLASALQLINFDAHTLGSIRLRGKGKEIQLVALNPLV